MTVLLRAAELVKRPVVTLAGDDIAQIKDVVYSSSTGELAGFTLNGRGVFAGPLRQTLPWANVHGLGPTAVMVRDEAGLADRAALGGEAEGGGGDVLGSTVITQSGRNLGTVTDVILDVGDSVVDAVGYEIQPSDGSAPRRQYVPLPDTLSVSGEALMVPDSAVEFLRDDLSGFGSAVEEFRTRLRKRPADADPLPGGKPPLSKPPLTKPVSDKPVSDRPVSDRPVLDKPVLDKPVSDTPRSDQPLQDKAGSGPPIPGKPGQAEVRPIPTRKLPIEDAE